LVSVWFWFSFHLLTIVCVRTCVQIPLYVATKMSKIRASFTAPSADQYAKCALAWIGYEPVITPYWVQSVMWFIIRLIPEPIMDSILLSKNLNIRRKGQAKENVTTKKD
jgi:17beta-estradiol 17-dehydrogenase / very-long-chain 3-oxoacyl-CoA reductase